MFEYTIKGRKSVVGRDGFEEQGFLFPCRPVYSLWMGRGWCLPSALLAWKVAPLGFPALSLGARPKDPGGKPA